MSVRRMQALHLWSRLCEARVAAGILAIIFGVWVIAILAFSRVAADRDPFGSSDPDVVCHTYGEVRQCFPATEGVRRYREERAARPEAAR